jgi:hypothetical protein
MKIENIIRRILREEQEEEKILKISSNLELIKYPPPSLISSSISPLISFPILNRKS